MAIYSSNKGTSIKDAIVISGVATHFEGIRAEYQYLSHKFGKQGIDWNLEMQALMKKGNRFYDKMTIRLADESRKVLFFEITAFFKKL